MDNLNLVDILAIIGAIDTLLYVITKVTPTKIDDQIFSVIHSFIAKLLGKKDDSILDK